MNQPTQLIDSIIESQYPSIESQPETEFYGKQKGRQIENIIQNQEPKRFLSKQVIILLALVLILTIILMILFGTINNFKSKSRSILSDIHKQMKERDEEQFKEPHIRYEKLNQLRNMDKNQKLQEKLQQKQYQKQNLNDFSTYVPAFIKQNKIINKTLVDRYNDQIYDKNRELNDKMKKFNLMDYVDLEMQYEL